MKKIFLLAGCFMLCCFGWMLPAWAAEGDGAAAAPAKAILYPDVEQDTPSGQAIYKMAESGMVSGYEDGTFRPQGQLTRAEFVTIVNGVFGYAENASEVAADFDDVDGHWAQGQIRIARQVGYIGGVGAIDGIGDACFAPDDTLTREQVAAMLGRILHLRNVYQVSVEISDAVSPWAKTDIEKAVVCGIMPLEEESRFRATEPMTRAEVCTIFAQYIQKDTIAQDIEQQRVQRAMLEAAEALDKLHYTEEKANTAVDALKDCVNHTLQAQWKGETISKEFLEQAYGAQIKETKKLYAALSKEERQALKADIIGAMRLNSLSVLYDYFLGDESST